MKTIEELREYLKGELAECKHAKDNSLAAQIDECIQFYWDEWDDDLTAPFCEGNYKPERYTKSFMISWIDSGVNEEDLEWWKEEGLLTKI